MQNAQIAIDDGVDVGTLCNDSDDESSYQPDYEWEQVVIEVFTKNKEPRPLCLEILSLVPPPLEYMSRLHSEQQEISGRQVWTGSLFLAHFLSQNQNILNEFKGRRILELGSGTGILGMSLAAICDSCLVLTDGDSAAIRLLQQNLARNHIPVATNDESLVSSSPSIIFDNPTRTWSTKLMWGSSHLSSFQSWCRDQNFERKIKDSNTAIDSAQSATFDCIVAGDVLYKPELVPLFIETVLGLLKRGQPRPDTRCGEISGNDEGALWLCHVPRYSVTHDFVIQSFLQAGLAIDIITTGVKWMKKNANNDNHALNCPADDLERAKIYRVYRKKRIE